MKLTRKCPSAFKNLNFYFMKTPTEILIFSVNIVFIEILKRILENYIHNYHVHVYGLFSDAQKLSVNDSTSLIIIDDTITGASSYELITFLRLQKEMDGQIMFFGLSEIDGEAALISGANYFISKPFNLREVTLIIKHFIGQSKNEVQI